MKNNTNKFIKVNIDKWRMIYSYVIPTFFVVLYIIVVLLMRIGLIDSDSIIDSNNMNNILEALITFVSIVMGIFGFLLPILITNKKDCGTVEFFLEKADKKMFVTHLKKIIISGFLVVANSSILFLYDILLSVVIDALIAILIWLTIFFMCNGYRFISLLLLILITEKESSGEKVKDKMNETQVSELNKKLKSKR